MIFVRLGQWVSRISVSYLTRAFESRAFQSCVYTFAICAASCGCPKFDEIDPLMTGKSRVVVAVSGSEKGEFTGSLLSSLGEHGLQGFHDVNHGVYSIYIFTDDRNFVAQIINDLQIYECSYEIILSE